MMMLLSIVKKNSRLKIRLGVESKYPPAGGTETAISRASPTIATSAVVPNQIRATRSAMAGSLTSVRATGP